MNKRIESEKFLEQISMIDAEETKHYAEFVEKFKPKVTTDDCFTPPLVYNAVLEYCVKRYGIDPEKVIRPFYPGGDYERENYPEGCVVIDNPPFSIISKIKSFYARRKIKFFLFSPYLTIFSKYVKGCTAVVTDVEVEYENGAKVATAFVTNLEPGTLARSDPDLGNLIEDANKENRIEKKRNRVLPKYKYPDNVLTASMLGYFSKHGIEFVLMDQDAVFIRQLDEQVKRGKTIFGAGYLISEKAAAEKAAAEKAAAEKAAAIRWKLSERELEIIKNLRDEEEREQ